MPTKRKIASIDEGHEDESASNLASDNRISKKKKTELICLFLNLPRELRDMIYSSAADGMNGSRVCPKDELLTSPIPFFGFVYSCKLICAEFRATWMGGHRVAARDFIGYIKTFLPYLVDTKHVFQEYWNPQRPLNATINRLAVEQVDVLPLLQLKALYPEYQVKYNFTKSRRRLTHQIEEFESTIFNCTNTEWLRRLQNGTFTRIYLTLGRLHNYVDILFNPRLADFDMVGHVSKSNRWRLGLDDYVPEGDEVDEDQDDLVYDKTWDFMHSTYIHVHPDMEIS